MAENKIPENIKDEITLKELISRFVSWMNFLFTKRKIIVLFALVGGLTGLAIALLTPPKYTGALTFILENNGKSKGGGVSNIAAQFGISLGNPSGGGVFQGDENIIAFIQSRNIIVRALLSEDPFSKGRLLVDRFIAFNQLEDEWKDDKRLAKIKFHPDVDQNQGLRDSLLSAFHTWILKEHLSVGQPDKKNDIIQIATVSPDPYFSKAFSEKLLENVTTFYIETQTKRAKENVEILRFQVDSIRSLLNTALTGAAVHNDANPNLNPAYQRLRVASQKRMVDVEMDKAILEELVKQLGLAEISLRKETPLVQVIDIPVLPMKPDKIGKAKGIIVGIFLGGFLTALFITLRQTFKKLLA